LAGGARAGGAEVQSVSLADTKIEPCRACDGCHRTGTCRVDDDFQKVRSAIESADGLVLASPNYISSVSAQMKAFMDRCCGPLHLQVFEGKYGAAVVTSGSESAGVEAYLLRFLQSLGLWTVGSIGAEGGKLADPSARDRVLDEAARLGARLVDAIRKHETFPDQTSVRRPFYERMRALVAMRKDDWPYEYEYWKSRGRL
jgi:multimeric flavodoxin WrbA